MDGMVLVQNADMSPLHRVSVKHAVRMVFRNVAEIVESEPEIRFGIWLMPKVVRLVRWVNPRWRYTAGPGWSRAGVLKRDGRRCGYCTGDASTVDHIVPSSRGGKNTWLNTVASCAPCNQRKGDRTPIEARMPLRLTPRAPSWASIAER